MTNREKLMQEITALSDKQFYDMVCYGLQELFNSDFGIVVCNQCKDVDKCAAANDIYMEHGLHVDFVCTCPWMQQECTTDKILDIEEG